MTKIILVLLAFLVLAGFEVQAQSIGPIPQTPEEQTLAPLLDLHNGGIATGAAQGAGPTQGALVNGTQLPLKGDGYKRISGENDSWGTGLMISMIINSAPLMEKEYPGNVINVGAIAQQFGGPYQPHKSHQSGLDADILFMGQSHYDSVLDKDGHVTNRFDTEKNWYYWRMMTSQQIKNGKKEGTAVSMILVDPRIKTFLCAWAKGREATLDALDREVLTLLRPTEGHDDHFHVRMHCSPDYTSCIDQGFGSVSKKTGCTEFDNPPTAGAN